MFLVLDEVLRREQPSWAAWFDELVDLEGDGSWCGRFRGELWLTVERDSLRVSGDLSGFVPRECDRCLGHYLEPLSCQVQDICLIGGTGQPDLPAVFDEEAEVWRVVPDGRVSITEMVRQAVLLALPTKALCGDVCPAAEWFAQAEAARQRAVDPRLAVLRTWLGPEEQDDGSPETTN